MSSTRERDYVLRGRSLFLSLSSHGARVNGASEMCTVGCHRRVAGCFIRLLSL